eukprot:3334977-Pyramimonas_sp.AAC.1
MEQLWVGNALCHAMLELFAAHMQAGASRWLGHPQLCEWRLQAVSSFTCHPMRTLQSPPAVSTTDFDQCER